MPVTAVIEGVSYAGVALEEEFADAGRMISYLFIGHLPGSIRLLRNICYSIPGYDWEFYVAHAKELATELGDYFQLRPWMHEEAIDASARKPFRRVEVEIQDYRG